MLSKTCDLCGLPLRNDAFSARFGDQKLHFCCAGCQMVYSMLMEAADAPDPARFKETDLYRRCVQAGVVPASEADLVNLNQAQSNDDKPDLSSDHGERTLTLRHMVHGMWCPACAWVIQTALERMEGIWSAGCDFSTDRLHCRYDPTRVSPKEIANVVKRLGYKPFAACENESARPLRTDFIRLIVSALLSVNIMMLSWALYSGFLTTLTAQGIRYISWPIFVMATIVMVYGGAPVMRKAWFGLRAGAPGMEALIVVGAGSAYAYSVVNFWTGSLHLYFDTATMLLTLLLLGKLLEAHAKIKVRHDLEGFLALQPNKVRLCSSTFPQGRYVAIDQLAVGDRFKVIADEVVPADGRVLQGEGQIDTSAITGEPRPVAAKTGDAVTSGSRVLSGELMVQTQRVGSDALLGQMIAIVQQSLTQKTALESRTDRWLALFVPLIIALALSTGIAGYLLGGLAADQALIRAVTVLVIACPCALGIAIPLARVGGIAGAGQRGILVRDHRAFDRVRPIDTIVLDKTGTITQGRWHLERIEVIGSLTAAQAISVAAGLEKQTDHTIARAVAEYAQKEGRVAASVEKVQGFADGVSGVFQGSEYKLGSRQFVTGQCADHTSQPPSEKRNPLPASQVYLSVDGQVAATLFFGDRLRDKVSDLVVCLKQSGMSLHLVSGDTPATVNAVGDAIGIDQTVGGLLPQAKVDYIARLQAHGRKVIMVGDGVNDAPAMVQSDLSVAVHTGAPLAHQAAAVTLMRGDPTQLLDFLQWSQRVNRKVRQNLVCALAYNLISIPVAMTGWLTPLVAVTAMLLSSLTVIGNTLLLVRQRP